jgi:hypothetical protein
MTTAIPPLVVLKSDGSREPFQTEKLEKSLRRAGASPEVVEEILSHLAIHHNGEMTSQQIYEHAFRRLKQHEPISAARYSLRRALFALGPTGFPFEQFVAELFRALGYVAQAGVRMQGKCMEHEVDVVAERGQQRIVAELKFHNDPSQRTDVKVALYVTARFQDIESHMHTLAQGWPYHTRRMLVTNTKFTRSAIRYAACAGLELLGWGYPPRRNLQDLIEQTRCIPITALPSLSKTQKEQLLQCGVILVRTLAENPDLLEKLQLSSYAKESVLQEARILSFPQQGVYTRW